MITIQGSHPVFGFRDLNKSLQPAMEEINRIERDRGERERE